jgi:hypothetical protein
MALTLLHGPYLPVLQKSCKRFLAVHGQHSLNECLLCSLSKSATAWVHEPLRCDLSSRLPQQRDLSRYVFSFTGDRKGDRSTTQSLDNLN